MHERGGSLLIVFALVGCAEVDDPVDGTGGASSSSTSSADAASSSSAGITSTGFSNTTSSVSSSGQGGELGGCAVVLDEEPFHVTHVGPNEEIYDAGCEDDQPTARVQPGGRCGPNTHVRACKSGGPSDLFEAWTPLLSSGQASMSGGNNAVMLTDVEVTITHFGEVGDAIIGHYEGFAADGDGASLPVWGSFKLCRAPDEPPCP